MSKKKRAPEVNVAFLAGLYTRVAKQAGVHPSYVSRVARGERRSDRVSRAIADELALFVPSTARTKEAPKAGNGEEYGQRLLRQVKDNAQLSKLKAVIVQLDDWGSPKGVPQVSRANLQSRIAANAAMMAASMEPFHRMSRKLETFAHVLSLADSDGVTLYSIGTTGAIHDQGRIPGANWGQNHAGPSAAARTIAAGVPVMMIGKGQPVDGLLPVRMGCPIRLGTREVAGVVVLSVELPSARAQHLVELASVARKICRVVEAERKRAALVPAVKQPGAHSATSRGA